MRELPVKTVKIESFVEMAELRSPEAAVGCLVCVGGRIHYIIGCQPDDGNDYFLQTGHPDIQIATTFREGRFFRWDEEEMFFFHNPLQLAKAAPFIGVVEGELEYAQKVYDTFNNYLNHIKMVREPEVKVREEPQEVVVATKGKGEEEEGVLHLPDEDVTEEDPKPPPVKFSARGTLPMLFLYVDKSAMGRLTQEKDHPVFNTQKEFECYEDRQAPKGVCCLVVPGDYGEDPYWAVHPETMVKVRAYFANKSKGE